MKGGWLKGLALLGEWPTSSKSKNKITIKGTHPQGTEVFIEAHVDEVEVIGAWPKHVAIPTPRPASEGDKVV